MYKDSSARCSPQPPTPTLTPSAVGSGEPTDDNYPTANDNGNGNLTTTIITTTATITTTSTTTAGGDPLPLGVDSEEREDYTRDGDRQLSDSNSSTTDSSDSEPELGGAHSLGSARRSPVAPRADAVGRKSSSSQVQRSGHVNADVRLLRKIGHIASRVRFLAKLYGDFRLVNPYSPTKQRKQLQEILLKHALPVHLLLPENNNPSEFGEASTRSLTPASSRTASYGCLPTDVKLEDDEEAEYAEDEREEAEDNEDDDDEDQTHTSTVGTVRRKSSQSSGQIAGSAASIALLEDILVKFYEDRRNKVTLIRRRRSSDLPPGQGRGSITNHKHLIIMSSKTMSSSVERLLQGGLHDVDDDDDDMADIRHSVEDLSQQKAPPPPPTPLQKSSQKPGQGTPASHQSYRSNSLLQPGSAFDEANNPRRRRASDCCSYAQYSTTTTTAAVPGSAAWANQLQVTLKNNNCAKLPFHRGSCGGAGEHLLAANSIANRSTIILSKSCGNVDGGSHTAGYDIKTSVSGGGTIGSTLNISPGGNGTTHAGGSAIGGGGPGNGSASVTNGNNEYSIVQLNNTIIQCHFNDEDFRALVKELKRKVEYTERMNWLCLSKRPMGPPHRKSSLPKHQEVKKRFLEICNTTFSDEVKSALRLPAFDSYEWGDADVIHLMQTMFVELGFIERFSIPVDTLREWLYEVYKHYNEVPFHNFRHCFCVAQMMYAITRQANLLQRLGDLECLILLVSCICHDLDHPGYNNIYQINARTELALRYNDISPLENHHCSIAFRLLEHAECNIFKNFTREQFNQIREGIIRCILATDMARHNEIVTQFKEITPNFDYNNRAHINLLCMVLIKVADISNEARPMDVAEPWLDRLLQEFFAQSAAEKSEGLPVTPFMDPDKVSKPGSQVRFIGLVLLPLFEALGDLVPEVIELIITPVRVALDYYRRLNDAQNKSRKSVPDAGSSIHAAGDNSSSTDGPSPSAAGGGHPPGSSAANAGSSGSGATASSAGNACSSASCTGSGGGGGGNVSPQLPRSQSGISVKSRRSIPSQKSASRTSVDEPQCIAAELHDLPEGSESGDSETATEVDVAEKTSKFKVDTEGSSNRSKSSHSTSRKSSREKRPSMIGEMCSSGTGQRIRNSYGNIHGYHSNRNQFGSNRAVSLDQYSTNNRRLSDGLQQVISDSNVFYNRHNRGSLEAASTGGGSGSGGSGSGQKLVEDLNMNSTAAATAAGGAAGVLPPKHMDSGITMGMSPASAATAALAALNAQARGSSGNGNISPTLHQLSASAKHPCCAAAAAAAAAASGPGSVTSSNGVAAGHPTAASTTAAKSSWKARLRQFSDYFSFSFDKNSSKRYGSTRSSPCPLRNNNAGGGGGGGMCVSSSGAATGGGGGGGGGGVGMMPFDPMTGKPTGICCSTISNNLQSPGLRHKHGASAQHTHPDILNAGRHRAYSLDVPCSHHAQNPRYSSSSGGGGDSSRKSSRHDTHGGGGGAGGAAGGGVGGDDNNSNNTLHSSGAVGSEMPTCLPPPIRIGSVDASDTILITTGLPRAITPATLGGAETEPSLSIDLGMASAGSSYEPPKI